MILADKSCPGSPFPCNYNGQCDHTTGQCICNEGHQGFDCSGNSKYCKVTGQNLWFFSSHASESWGRLTQWLL